jgi:hypothetical protein
MRLLEHQMALGERIRGAGAPVPMIAGLDQRERAELARLLNGSGFRFTRQVQRSWCKGRAASAARLTLSALPAEQRYRLIDQWVEAGGGTASLVSSEAVSFLDFIARDLADPSYALTLCRMEQAMYRASEAAMRFRAPDTRLLDYPEAFVRAGKGAALVVFLTEPQRLFDAVETGGPLPPLCGRSFPVLFAPGLSQLCRAASDDEVALWERLTIPFPMRDLRSDRYAREVMEELLSIGAAELQESTTP